ncbi:MAG: hypothetical protein V8R64_06735 [Thomasclavelia sp.]
MYWFFGTEIGSAISATGNNEHMVRALGINTDTTKLLGLMITNGLIAISGALVAPISSNRRYVGIGAIVIGLASIVIGEVVNTAKKAWFHDYFNCYYCWFNYVSYYCCSSFTIRIEY